MDAKEYLTEKDIPNEVITIQRDGWIEGHNLSTLLESYHQSKLLQPPPISESKIFEVLKEMFPDHNVPYLTEVAEAINQINQ